MEHYFRAGNHTFTYPESFFYDLEGEQRRLYVHNDLIPKWRFIWRNSFQPGDTVLDIGAFMAGISLHLISLGAKVEAFEGSPRNYKRLEQLTVENFHIHKVALSNKSLRCITRFNDCIGLQHPEQEIQYVLYDEYARSNGIKDPKFVKMDIEGMESVALLGMKNLIEKIRPIWQIEYHEQIKFCYSEYPGFVSKDNGGFDFNIFKDLDYITIDEQIHVIKKMETFKNYFFIPKERFIYKTII